MLPHRFCVAVLMMMASDASHQPSIQDPEIEWDLKAEDKDYKNSFAQLLDKVGVGRLQRVKPGTGDPVVRWHFPNAPAGFESADAENRKTGSNNNGPFGLKVTVDVWASGIPKAPLTIWKTGATGKEGAGDHYVGGVLFAMDVQVSGNKKPALTITQLLLESTIELHMFEDDGTALPVLSYQLREMPMHDSPNNGQFPFEIPTQDAASTRAIWIDLPNEGDVSNATPWNFWKDPKAKKFDILRQLGSRKVGDKVISEFAVRNDRFQSIVFAKVVPKEGEPAQAYPVASVVWNGRYKYTPTGTGPQMDFDLNDAWNPAKTTYEGTINIAEAKYALTVFPDEPTIRNLLKSASQLNLNELGHQAYKKIE